MKTLIAIVLLPHFVFGCHEDEIEEVDEVPLWQLSHQDVWYYAASIHADLRPEGTPQWARDIWDEIVLIDPNAPMEYRPFWAMKSGGLTALAPAFYDEIRERTAAGYRVIYTYKGGSQSPEPEDAADVAGLRADVETMAALDALPWGIGLWNELEFGGSGTAEELQQFSDKMTFVALPSELAALQQEFGVMISPPGFSSFSNVVLEGYGEVIADLFNGVDGVFIKVHSYGHVDPQLWVDFDLKEEVRRAVAMPNAIVILEETANAFVGEHGEPKPGVGDQEGADFMHAAMYAGMQIKIPTCHFLLYHAASPAGHFNDISDPVEGKLRRETAKRGTVGPSNNGRYLSA
jgi:hypothetical protein